MKACFKQSGLLWVEQIFQDIRFSFRMLRKKPGFTAIAVISLSLAIGVNSGVFSIANALLFRPFIPLRPNEVVRVYTRGTAADSDYRFFSFSEFSLLRESSEVFADVSAYQMTTSDVRANSNSEIRRRTGFVVSDNYFSMLGVTPAAGRFFLPEESRPKANIPVAVVSQALWESLGGGIDFSERTVNIHGEICTIVGVAPKGFSSSVLGAPDFWLPLGMGDRIDRIFSQGLVNGSAFALAITARLKPGLTLEAAKAHLSVIAARLTTIAADDTEGARTLEIKVPPRFDSPLMQPSYPDVDGPIVLLCLLLIGMAGVVLLVACLNLANMFLARNITRFDELSVRLALGASRRRVIRALSIEGLIIALMGGAAGLVLSRWANGLLLDSLTNSSALSSLGLSLSLDTTPDIRILSATLLFCVIAALVFAVAPAWHAIREIAKGNLSLHHSTRTATDRSGRLFSGRHCLLMAQLALSLALLFSAGLFSRAALSAARIDPGFTPEGDLVAEIDYSLVNRDEASVQASVFALVEALRAYPEVQKVAISSHIPFGATGTGYDVSTIGTTGKQELHANGTSTAVSRGYFDILGVKLLRGRDFTDKECLQAERSSVVIIDQSMADALFPGEDPLGKYIRRNLVPGKKKSELMEIVGVVSAHMNDVIAEDPPRLFFPMASQSPQRVFIQVRGQTTDAAKSGAFREAVRSKLQSIDPDIPLVSIMPYPAILNDGLQLWPVRFAAVLFGVFGAIALLLAVIGVYGVRAFVVARRTREIGIRMALGATPRRIYALLMKQGIVQIAIGLGVGGLLSLGTGKLLACILLRVSPRDPVVLVLAAMVLALTALLATWIPVRRAAKVDPMEVLRWE